MCARCSGPCSAQGAAWHSPAAFQDISSCVCLAAQVMHNTFFFNSCSHTVVFVWICAVQKGHLVAKWKIGDMNYRGNCLLQEEMMGDRIPGNPQALHHQTVFEPLTLWNWPVCRFRIPKPGVFLNIPCTFQLWLRAEECTESVVCLFVYLFIFLTVVLSGTGNFLLSSTCLVPSLQSHGVVPNNTERKTGREEKKKGNFDSFVLYCSVQKSGIFVFGGEVPEL